MNPTQPTAAVSTPADQYATLKSAVLGAQTNVAPGASPLGSFPELSKLYTTAPQLAQQTLSSAAPNYNSGVDAANEKATTDANAAAAVQKLKDLQDPSKYQQVQKPDGGYAFYDPLGNEISASQYAAVNKSTPSDVLKNSQNPVDIAYRQDYNNLQTYINAKLRSGSSQKQADIATGIEDQVKSAYGINIAKMSPQQLIQTFQAAYPTVYGGTNKGVPDSTTLIPNGNDIYTGA